MIMKSTPITDEVIKTLSTAVGVFDLLPKSVSDIKAGGKHGEMVARSLSDGVQWRLDCLNSCTTTIDDVRREWWETCPSIESLQDYTAMLGTKFGAAKIPADIEGLMEANNEAYSGLWELDRGEIVWNLTMIALTCWQWVEAVKSLIAEFRQMKDGVTKERLRQTDGFDEHQSEQATETQSLNPEPQQMELKDLLPKKLKADEAVEVFQNAIDAQLITNSPEGLKWNDTKQLLAYFATKVSDKFNLTTKLDKDGNKTTDWKTFETLFEQIGLKGAKQNWMRLNTKFEPTGFEKVDALF